MDVELDAEEQDGLESLAERLIAAGVIPGSAADGAAAAGQGNDTGDVASAKKRIGDQLKEHTAGLVRKRAKKRQGVPSDSRS